MAMWQVRLKRRLTQACLLPKCWKIEVAVIITTKERKINSLQAAMIKPQGKLSNMF